jgi:hypothetical protein
MSYSVYAYLTDAQKVSSVYGSKSREIYNELSRSLKNDLEDLNGYFSKDTGPVQNASEVLKDLINGKIRFPDIPHMYGYVYEKICEYFGRQIYASENMWELEKQSAFMPIPFSAHFPYIISIKKSRLDEKKKKFLSLKEGEGIGDYDYDEETGDLTYILDEAIEQSKDLVICMY